jgi:hypothetical protein
LTRAELYRRVMGYLNDHPCVDCGEGNRVVLHFDHVRGVKRMSIAELVRDYHPWETVTAEIANCEVRCANCHLIRTAKQLGWRKHFEVQLGAVDEQVESAALQAASVAGSSPVCAV